MNAIADILGKLLGSILIVNLQNRAMLREILKKLNVENRDINRINKLCKGEYARIADNVDKEHVWIEQTDLVKN